MTDRTITLEAAEAEKFTALPVGESMWIVRDDTECGWCRGTDDDTVAERTRA